MSGQMTVIKKSPTERKLAILEAELKALEIGGVLVARAIWSGNSLHEWIRDTYTRLSKVYEATKSTWKEERGIYNNA